MPESNEADHVPSETRCMNRPYCITGILKGVNDFMTNEEIFRSQWLRLQEEVTERIDTTIAGGGDLSFSELNKFYKGKMVRWEGYARTEGRWLEDVEDAARKEAFLTKLHSVTLTEIPAAAVTGMAPALAGVIGGVGAAIVSMFLGGWAVCIVCMLLGFAVPFSVLSSKHKAALRAQNEKLKKQYIAQMIKTGEELADIWR